MELTEEYIFQSIIKLILFAGYRIRTTKKLLRMAPSDSEEVVSSGTK